MGYRRHDAWLSSTALLCLTLAACNKNPAGTAPASGAPIAALQLATATPPPPTYAPPASALPPAPRAVAYRPSPEHWRYLTDAYGMSDAFADTPPDYTVAYDGEDPYVWRADDGAYRVVEWLPDGARYYYYEPGADEPFLIQDPDYSYAYDNGALVAVYTLAGALVADRIAAEREGYAARYYSRGHDLYRAAVNDRRRAAYAANWQQRAPMIQAQRQRWQRGSEEQPAWRDWNRAHQAQQDARWAPERQHRATYAAALGAAGVAGAAYAMHHRNAAEAPRAAETGPTPQPVNGDRRPVASPNGNRPDLVERHAEAQHIPASRHVPAPQREEQRQPQPAAVQADRNRPNLEGHRAGLARQPRAQQALAQPQTVPQARIAERREMAHGQQAQQHAAQQAQRAEMPAQRRPEIRTPQPQRPQFRTQPHVAAPRVEMPHVQPPHVEATHPAPAPHAQIPRPQPSHPAPQQHGNSGKDNRHH